MEASPVKVRLQSSETVIFMSLKHCYHYLKAGRANNEYTGYMENEEGNGYSTIRSRADMDEQMVNDQYVMVTCAVKLRR
ncbi:hypothetical protein F2Q69_00021267 [Brassica cretica]|uniref:Uncharacterized protein n=1 Tax=Brassica cretica TaxID=69181 RepID=A0A8S9PZR1_BRACR|nr:hypothetical protein F2Q69_00021267 [Brassica cretica]